jgi:hypothetical protein
VDNTGPDMAMLADARRMADIGDVEGAHKKANTLPPSSPLHTSADYQYVEMMWAQALLLKADNELDPPSKAALYQMILADPHLNATTRKLAQDHLSMIDLNGGAKPHVGSSATVRQPVTQPGVAIHPTPNVAPPPPVEPPPPPPPPHVTAPKQSIADLMADGSPAALDKARKMLEGKVFGNKGSQAEVRQLLAICKQQHDSECVSTCRSLQK